MIKNLARFFLAKFRFLLLGEIFPFLFFYSFFINPHGKVKHIHIFYLSMLVQGFFQIPMGISSTIVSNPNGKVQS
jgi:hypothetical protein